MFKVQCSYFLKRFLIVCLMFVILISVEIAPDIPVFFAAALCADLVCVKFIWKSLLEDERKIKKRKSFRFSHYNEVEVS